MKGITRTYEMELAHAFDMKAITRAYEMKTVPRAYEMGAIVRAYEETDGVDRTLEDRFK